MFRDNTSVILELLHNEKRGREFRDSNAVQVFNAFCALQIVVQCYSHILVMNSIEPVTGPTDEPWPFVVC